MSAHEAVIVDVEQIIGHVGVHGRVDVPRAQGADEDGSRTPSNGVSLPRG